MQYVSYIVPRVKIHVRKQEENTNDSWLLSDVNSQLLLLFFFYELNKITKNKKIEDHPLAKTKRYRRDDHATSFKRHVLVLRN